MYTSRKDRPENLRYAGCAQATEHRQFEGCGDRLFNIEASHQETASAME